MPEYEFIYTDRVSADNKSEARKICIDALRDFVKGNSVSVFCKVKKIG